MESIATAISVKKTDSSISHLFHDSYMRIRLKCHLSHRASAKPLSEIWESRFLEMPLSGVISGKLHSNAVAMQSEGTPNADRRHTESRMSSWCRLRMQNYFATFSFFCIFASK